MKLPANYEDDAGRMDYTAIGQADADLTSAIMAIGRLLGREDLTASARKDFGVALRSAQRAARAVGRHVDYDAVLSPAMTESQTQGETNG